MSKLLDNLWRMPRRDINALARNPYIDEDIQLRIAEKHHLKAREYLAENENLCIEARDILWSGKSTVVKGKMVSSGHYNQEPDKITELYKSKGPAYWFRSPWRMSYTFFQTWRCIGQINSSEELLDTIHSNHFLEDSNYLIANSYYVKSGLRALARHPNIGTELAIQLSHSEIPEVRQTAFAALIRIKKQSKQK